MNDLAKPQPDPEFSTAYRTNSDRPGGSWLVLRNGFYFCEVAGADDETAATAKRMAQILNTFWHPRRIL